MHDPESLLFRVELPLPWKRKSFRGKKEWDKVELFSVWHVDPCTDGTDDSCGRFKRSRHGNQDMLERIRKEFEFGWDSTFSPGKDDHDDEDGPFVHKTYQRGYFHSETGLPMLSDHAIALNLFLVAAGWTLGKDGSPDWEKGRKFVRKHLLDILMFAENTVDSMHDGMHRVFAIGCNEPYTKRHRDERISSFAGMIYGWIIRESSPWWKNPLFHLHHWRVQCRPLNLLKRALFTRCKECGKSPGFSSNVVCDHWHSVGPRWFRGEEGITCGKCSQNQCCATTEEPITSA